MMIVIRSTSKVPEDVVTFLRGCREFYMCYVIDLRGAQSKEEASIDSIRKRIAPQVRMIEGEGLRVETCKTC